MDPSSIAGHLVREIALDGSQGVDKQRLWDLYSRQTGLITPLDEDLKPAIWNWVLRHPGISITNNDVLIASEDLQWSTLTGSPRNGNSVGNLAFDLLCVVARSREIGVSTIEASKITGQDLRSLFGRVQLLVNQGLVQRYPVIENGSSTNRMIFHAYSKSHQAGEAIIDKQAVAIKITEYCKSGVQGVRSLRAIVRDIGMELDQVKKARKRPTIMNILRELESLGCIRKITMVHPDLPDKQFTCIEYVRDFETRSDVDVNPGIAGSIILPPSRTEGNDADNDEVDDDEVAEDGDDDDDDDDDDDYGNDVNANGEHTRVLDDTSRAIVTSRSNRILANTYYPLTNQIYDVVESSGSKGISAMDLTRRLTGISYRKALGKYLDGLTAVPPKGTNISELEHLGLVKGVDFNKKVKFYRYFTKLNYAKEGPNNSSSFLSESCGDFLTKHLSSTPSTSLYELSLTHLKPLPGVCTVVKTPNGYIKPVFHGDKEVQGEVILKSSPADTKLPVTSTEPGKRKRGRPRKNEPKIEISEQPSSPPKLPPARPVVPPLLDSDIKRKLSVKERIWEGGRPSNNNGDVKLSRWLVVHDAQQKSTELLDSVHSSLAPNSHNKKAHLELSPCKSPKGDQQPAKELVNCDASSDHNSRISSSLVGSLAMANRIKTLLKIIQDSNGVLQGGAPLLDKFNSEVSGEYTVDRRTVNSVVDKLVRDGTLQKIYVNVPTASGKSIIKYVLYDPVVITAPESDPRIQDAKSSLVEGNKEKHAQATRAALDAARIALNKLPKREMTDEQMEALRPNFLTAAPRRILSTRSKSNRSSLTNSKRERTRFGPSAAEVLGVDAQGAIQSRVKRPSRRPVSRANADASDALGQISIKQEATLVENIVPGSMPESFAGPLIPSETVLGGSTEGFTEVPATSAPHIDLDALARSVIIFRSLFSPNSSANVDWKVIAAVNPGIATAGEARRLWPDARSELASYDPSVRISDIVLVKSKQFEYIFLEAYKRGLVTYEENQDPRIAIPLYIKWWRDAEEDRLIDKISDENMHGNPDSGQLHVLRRLENLKLRDRRIGLPEIDPCGTLQSQVSIVNAEKLLFGVTFGVPMNRSFASHARLTDNEMRLRAVIAADNGPSYSPENAARELVGFSESDTEAAKAGLESKKVIQWGESDPGKVPTGRPFVLNELVENTLTVSKFDFKAPHKLVENFTFFRNSESSIKVPSTVDESDMMSLIELATFGFNNLSLKLRRLGERFGLISSDYKSRGIDKNEFDCDIVCDISLDSSGPKAVSSSYILPPDSGNPLRPWIWQTRYLTSQRIWYQITYKILMIVLLRPGITSGVIALNLRAALDYEESIAAVRALVQGGALTVSRGNNGLFVVPNWFEFIVPNN